VPAVIAKTLKRKPITDGERLPANESEMSSSAVSYAEEEDKVIEEARRDQRVRFQNSDER
jgi:hypothetical protein